MNQLLLYLASALVVIWGTAHLFPTRSVVKGFGEISEDNRRILTMEWILEGVSLVFIGVLVMTVTACDVSSVASKAAYVVSAATLVVFAIVSLFTGFRVSFFPFKLCPFIFLTSAVLIFFGGIGFE